VRENEEEEKGYILPPNNNLNNGNNQNQNYDQATYEEEPEDLDEDFANYDINN
jgi:hypothetical protein